MPVARVSAAYGLKRPLDPANTFAGSEESHVSYSVEFEIAGLGKEQTAKALADLARELDGGVKLAVAASLDVGFQTDETGIVRLTPVVVSDIPHAAAPPARPPARRPAPSAPTGRPAYSGAAGRGGGRRPAPTRDDLPVVWLTYFEGKEPVAFYDQRELKAAGKMGDRAPDFRSVDAFPNKRKGTEDSIPLWLTDRDGNPDSWAQHLLAEAEQRQAAEAPF